MTTLAYKQSIGRGTRVKKLPTPPQMTLFEEEKEEGTWATVTYGDSLEGGSLYYQGTACVATTPGDIYTIADVNQMVASHQYTASDFAMLRDKVEELEKKLLEYTERDAKMTTQEGFSASSYVGTVSDFQFATVSMVEDPVCPEAKLPDDYRTKQGI